MIHISFNENDWTFDVVNIERQVLAAVYDQGDALILANMYQWQETEDKEIQQQKQIEEDMENMGWRVEDNKGGE